MLRQYIGARYVPIVKGVWSPDEVYEPLCIVQYPDAFGASYTSKKSVPAGIAPTDGEFWALTGNYNAQITAIQNQVNSLVPIIDKNTDDIEVVENKLLNRKFLLLADSYGMRSTSQPTWTELFVTRYPTTRQKSVGSRGFAVAGNTFLQGITDFYNELTETQREEITDIVVCGGWNDARFLAQGGSSSALQRAIFEFVDYCNTNFPNATPWIGFIGWQTSDITQSGTIPTLAHLLEAQQIYNWSAYKNLKVLEGVSDVMKDSYNFDETYFHPNPIGSQNLFFGISRALYGGFRYEASRTGINKFAFNNASGTVSALDVSISGSTAKISMLISNLTMNTENEVGDFDANFLPWAHNMTIKMQVIDYTNDMAYYGVFSKRKLRIYKQLTNATVLIIATIDATHEI